MLMMHGSGRFRKRLSFLKASSSCSGLFETLVERTRDNSRGSQRTEPCGEKPTVSQSQHITSAAR
jgi:hypothetical protein